MTDEVDQLLTGPLSIRYFDDIVTLTKAGTSDRRLMTIAMRGTEPPVSTPLENCCTLQQRS